MHSLPTSVVGLMTSIDLNYPRNLNGTRGLKGLGFINKRQLTLRFLALLSGAMMATTGWAKVGDLAFYQDKKPAPSLIAEATQTIASACASIVTPAPTASAPTINLALRLPGQYEDAETGLHYNLRRYYDPDTGRYWTQDPIGLEGGINLFTYAHADPINLTDPTGEIAPIVVAGAVCMASCMAATAAEDLITGECTTVGTSAKNCAIGCALGGVGALAMKVGKWATRVTNCGRNSFAADTLVHIQPADIANSDGNETEAAAQGKSQLKPISQLQPGDKVLALAEWKAVGNSIGQDQRLSYEKVTDVFTSHREQTHVFLTLDNGQTLQATEGHPFLTSEGWRDAILLKKGGKLLIKGEAADDSDPQRYANILETRQEIKAVPVFNIEVANAHTFFVGDEGVLVHNGKRCTPWGKLAAFRGKTKTDGNKLYERDFTHGDMEVYDKRGNHLGSANMTSGEMTKPPVPGRKIKL